MERGGEGGRRARWFEVGGIGVDEGRGAVGLGELVGEALRAITRVGEGVLG